LLGLQQSALQQRLPVRVATLPTNTAVPVSALYAALAVWILAQVCANGLPSQVGLRKMSRLIYSNCGGFRHAVISLAGAHAVPGLMDGGSQRITVLSAVHVKACCGLHDSVCANLVSESFGSGRGPFGVMFIKQILFTRASQTPCEEWRPTTRRGCSWPLPWERPCTPSATRSRCPEVPLLVCTPRPPSAQQEP
jgi:hypothetical protein